MLGDAGERDGRDVEMPLADEAEQEVERSVEDVERDPERPLVSPAAAAVSGSPIPAPPVVGFPPALNVGPNSKGSPASCAS